MGNVRKDQIKAFGARFNGQLKPGSPYNEETGRVSASFVKAQEEVDSSPSDAGVKPLAQKFHQ